MDHKEFDALLAEAEVRLERLRALYEQWFQGVERLEPAVPAKDVERRMWALRKVQAQVRNTAMRFKFQTLWQRYNTYQTYWRRVGRQIEEGTYRRDVMRVRARREESRNRRDAKRERQDEAAQSWDVDLDIDVDEALADAHAAADDATTLRPAAPTPAPSPKPASSAPVPKASKAPKSFVSPFARARASQAPASPSPGPETPRPRRPDAPPAPPAAARKGPPPPPSPRASGLASSLGEDRIRTIYEQYVDARKRNNERTDNVRYETMAKNIRDMVPKLQQKHRGKDIDFEVVVRNGRVGLKPVPKK